MMISVVNILVSLKVSLGIKIGFDCRRKGVVHLDLIAPSPALLTRQMTDVIHI